MARTPARRSKIVVELDHQRHMLRRQREQDQRVLDALYNISLACRDRPNLRTILETIHRELVRVFSFDAVYIALCDVEPETFSAALLVDEGEAEYIEGLEYGFLTGMIVRDRVPLLYRDLATERDPAAPRVMFGNTQKRSRSWLGVPLMVGPDAVGVISIQSYQIGIYTLATQDLLQRMANVVAVAVENVRLIDLQGRLSQALAAQVAARTEEIDALSSIASAVVARQPLSAVLDQALGVAISLFRFDAGNVRLLDDARQHLVLQAHRGFDPQYAAVTAYSPLHTSPLRKVVLEGRSQVIERGWRARFNPGRFPVQVFPAFDCALSVPLSFGASVLGTLSLFGLSPRAFSEHEVRLAQSVANQIAIVVENTRLLEERERQISELRAMSSVSRAASTAQDLRTLQRQVHDALKEFVPLDGFSMLIYDPDRAVVSDAISIEDGRTYDYWGGQPPPPRSLSAWIIRSGLPLRFDNLPDQIADIEGLARHRVGSERQSRSWLGVPMVDRDSRVIGVISVQGYTAGLFGPRDESLLHNVAAQVALHVQNVRLIETTQAHAAAAERQATRMELVHRIASVLSARLDQQEILEIASRELVQLFWADHTGTVLFVDERAGVLAAEYPPTDSLGLPVSLHDNLLIADLHRTRRPLVISDIANDPRAAASRETFTAMGINSLVVVPLISRDRIFGSISLDSYNERLIFSDEELDLMMSVATSIAAAVENAQLFAAEQEQRRTADTLREMARVLSSSFNPDEVLRLILGELHKVIAYDTASIMLLDGDLLRMVASRGRPGGDDARGISLPLEGSAAGEVVRRRAPLLWVAGRGDVSWAQIPTASNIRAWIGAPLIARGNMLGVLNIDIRSERGPSFSERDIEVARTFANHAAVALENAQLYQESVARVEQELEIARRIQSNLFPRQLPSVGGLIMAARCLPARETGGDFYDVIDLGSRVGVIVGDVSGKSIPAAMLMAVARSTSRSEARNHETPWVVLTETNRWLVDDVPKNAFVALSYAVVDPQMHRMTLANGGQLSPLLRRADGSTSFVTAPSALPLGIIPDATYGQVEIDLAPGDTILFYTDGIVEAHDQCRSLFGFDRVEALLARWGHLSPDDLIALILVEVARFAEGTPTHDDMTLVAVRVG